MYQLEDAAHPEAHQGIPPLDQLVEQSRLPNVGSADDSDLGAGGQASAPLVGAQRNSAYHWKGEFFLDGQLLREGRLGECSDLDGALIEILHCSPAETQHDVELHSCVPFQGYDGIIATQKSAQD
jgi:hypothetical protein